MHWLAKTVIGSEYGIDERGFTTSCSLEINEARRIPEM
jgi:hypothetical protein